MIEEKQRRIKSFVKREGRLTPAQQEAISSLWEKYGLDSGASIINLQACFERSAKCVLEIGFGMGASLLEMAIAQPEVNFLGIEVHRPGVGRLLSDLEKHSLTNVKIMNIDAVEILQKNIAEQSLSRIQIYFPDPWHKKRHHKRRLIQKDFVKLLHSKLEPEGILHMATDWQNYAEHMLEVMQASEGWENLSDRADGYSEKPDWRPLTKFEKRGIALEHGVWDLLFSSK